MRILFSVRNPWYVRHYDSVLRRLAADGHTIDLVADGLGRAEVWPPSVLDLARDYPNITLRWTPVLVGEPWYEFGTRVRQALYFLRFLQPEYAGMPMLLARAEEKAPPAVVALARAPLLRTRAGLSLLRRILDAIEHAVPPSREMDRLLDELTPDVVVVTPLIILKTVQTDLVRAAMRRRIPTAFAVASWDHLSSKGILRTVPDRVLVWNAVQRREATELHGVPDGRIRATGAQLFDTWFAPPSLRTRDEFCARAGIDPARPFVLYVCSALFRGSPNEAAFAAEWARAARRSPHPALREAGILIRPHPRRAEEWAGIDLGDLQNVSLYPPLGAAPVDDESRDDYYDSMRFAAAVVGLNTSAMVEAAILGRPVLTVLLPVFSPNQEGTVHFRYLLEGETRLLEWSRSLDEHFDQLALAVAAGERRSERSDAFVARFIRPHGREVDATDRFVGDVAELAGEMPAGAPPDRLGGLIRLLCWPLAVRAGRKAVRERAQRLADKLARRRRKVDQHGQTK